MPVTEYEYPAPTEAQVLAHKVLATDIMGWRLLDEEPGLLDTDETIVFVRDGKLYRSESFQIADRRMPHYGKWMCHFYEWSPSTDPHASKMLRDRLIELGWGLMFREVAPSHWLCRVKRGDTELFPVEDTELASGTTLEESLVWTAMEVIISLRTDRSAT